MSLTWEELKAREERAGQKCDEAVKRHFPSDKYEVSTVSTFPYEDSVGCLVDFKRKGYEPEIDCGEYCEPFGEEEEYNECLEDCEDGLKTSIVGSIAFDPDTLSIKEATIPGSCQNVWMSEAEEDPEEWEKERRKLDKKFQEVGCHLGDSWIHPHELVGGGEWEEYPAVCYAHPSAIKEGKCRVPDVMPLIEQEFSPPRTYKPRALGVVV